MYISVKDIFKVGIGPSSSHTMGPMVAAARFMREAEFAKTTNIIERIRVSLHGSLAFTGRGHGTDRAVLLGLQGFEPASMQFEAAEVALRTSIESDSMQIGNGRKVNFKPSRDLVFDFDVALPGHPNGMRFELLSATGDILLATIFYSVGGGFVLTEGELLVLKHHSDEPVTPVPFPFASAASMLSMSANAGLSISQMKRANETASGLTDLDDYLDNIWVVMEECISRGLSTTGLLPGGLSVRRRAAEISRQLDRNELVAHSANEWLMVYAMAVNEENAAGGRIVTAPTNGAAGVVPAVLKYYVSHMPNASQEGVRNFLLTASAIGGLIKFNASISGAEVGCQGEVGSASAMAAAGLCAALGASSEQIENAAEIALEHHLGMTCDPIAGLVQIPCIERNGLGAVKALSAALLSMRSDGSHLVPLDTCIETMRQTGKDMNSRYKETSLGGLAVNLPEC